MMDSILENIHVQVREYYTQYGMMPAGLEKTANTAFVI